MISGVDLHLQERLQVGVIERCFSRLRPIRSLIKVFKPSPPSAIRCPWQLRKGQCVGTEKHGRREGIARRASAAEPHEISLRRVNMDFAARNPEDPSIQISPQLRHDHFPSQTKASLLATSQDRTFSTLHLLYLVIIPNSPPLSTTGF